MKWVVTGQVFLADGFDYEIEADTEARAREMALGRAKRTAWCDAEIQEVCINSVQKVEETAEVAEPVAQIMVALTRGQCEALRSLAYQEMKHTDDAAQQDFLGTLVDQIEQAEED